MRLFRKHTNNVGFHFYMPLKPHHLFTCDMYIIRLNVFWPFFVSMSFGILGFRGFQMYAGIKYDPTEAVKLGEYDYLFSAAFRRIPLGHNCRVNSEASF